MKTFIFDSEIERDEVLDLINDIENSKDKNIVVYFNSTGGTVSYAELLSDYINQTSKTKNYTFIAYYFLESCAFDFFLKINCRREIRDTCHIMAHLSKPTIDGKVVSKTARAKHTSKYLKDFFEEVDKMNETYCIFYKEKGMPDELIDKIKKGDDVVVPIELMKKLIKK